MCLSCPSFTIRLHCNSRSVIYKWDGWDPESLICFSYLRVLFVYLVLIEQMQGKFLSELFSISILPTLPKHSWSFSKLQSQKKKKYDDACFFGVD